VKNQQIVSPIARGSGAYVAHRLLERYIGGYRVLSYNPYGTLLPLLLRTAISTKGAKLIHSTPDYAYFFYQKKTPLVLTFHGYVIDGCLRPYYSWFKNMHHLTDLRLWTRLAIHNAHTVTAVSHFLARLVQKDQKISPPIRVIYNGVDESHFTPLGSSTFASKSVRVFFSGNLTRPKGAHWLPSIARKLQKNVHIFYTQGLRTRDVLFSHNALRSVGSVPFEEMPHCYRQMDMLLVTTVREGFCLAIAEAMACGLPVIASNCSAIPELVDDGKGGFLCPIGDVNAFAERINLLADSPKLRFEMGEYNRSKVEKLFTLHRMVKEYQELFEMVLDGHDVNE